MQTVETYDRAILVVDDEKNYRIVLANLLSKAGYRVFTADGPGRCLDILREQRVALVISDLRLAGTDGVAMCRKIVEEFGPLPCILFSACLSPQALAEMPGAGIVGYLGKPFDNRELLNLVAKILPPESSRNMLPMFARQPGL